MATVSDLRVAIGADITDLDRKLTAVQKKLKAVGGKMTSVGKSLSVGLTAPLTLLGGAAVVAAVDMERLGTQLNVLTGSAEAGAKAFERLKKFSAQTPFQLGDLVSVNNTLMGFGMNADQAFNSLSMLGDISAVTGADLDRVAVAFGQSAAAGRVMTQDLNQFINNGIPIYQLLGDVTGKNVGELRDLASQGGITFDLLNQAFAKATSEGGKFFEGTKTLSTTLGGQLSTLKDNMTLMLGEFGKVIGDGLKPLISLATKAAQWIGSLSDAQKKWMVGIGLVVAAIGPLLAGLGVMVGTVFPAVITGFAAMKVAMLAVTGPIGLVVLGIGALATVIIMNWQKVKEITVSVVSHIIERLRSMLDTFLSVVGKVAGLLNDDWGDAVKGARDKINSFAGSLKDSVSTWDDVKAATVEEVSALANFTAQAEKAKSATDELNKSLSKRTTGATTGVTPSGPGQITPQPAGVMEIEDPFTEIKEDATDANSHMQNSFFSPVAASIKSLMGSLSNAGASIKEKLGGAFQAIGAVAGEVLGLISQGIQNQIDKVNLEHEEATRIGEEKMEQEIARVENSALSEEAKEKKIAAVKEKYEKKKAAAEEKVDKKRRALKRKAAKADKAAALIMAVINTALGVSAQFQAGPAGIALAAIVGALGAAQIGLIASQPIPQFAEGGAAHFTGPAMLHGTRSKPEIITPFDKIKSMFGGAAQMIIPDVTIRGEDLVLVFDRHKRNALLR